MIRFRSRFVCEDKSAIASGVNLIANILRQFILPAERKAPLPYSITVNLLSDIAASFL